MWQDTDSSKHLQQENLTNRIVRLHVTLTLINGLDWDNILKMPSSFISNSETNLSIVSKVLIFSIKKNAGVWTDLAGNMSKCSLINVHFCN